MKLSSTSFIGIVLLSCCSFLSKAQFSGDSLLYEGTYQIGRFKGQATFFYKLDNQDTLLHGNFQMEGSNLPALLSGKGSYFSFIGAFQQNEPNGQWSFEFGDYTASHLTKVDTHQYQLAINGIQQQAKGKLQDGQAEGKWIQKVQRIEASRPNELIFESEITFKQGIPQQSFRMENAECVLLGRFKRNGLAHDVWTLYANLETTENWYFQEGRLDKIEIQQKDGVETIQIFSPVAARTTLIALDTHYFRLLNIWQQMAIRPSSIGSGRVANLLTTNASNYEKLSELINERSSSNFRFLPKVSVPHFPLSNKEQKKLSTIGTYLQKVDDIYQSLKNNTSLSILVNTDQETAYQMAALQAINDQLLAPIRTLHDIQEENILQFLDQSIYYSKMWTSGISPKALSITLNGQRQHDLHIQTFNIQEEGLTGIEEMMKYVLQRVDSIQSILNEKLNTKERRQELMALEKQVMREFSLLDSLIESQNRKVRKTCGLYAVQEAANQALEDYAALSNTSNKQEQAQELIRCMQELDALATTLIQLPQKVEKIEALYTDEIWNNFTATVMEDKVKKHLLNAYQVYLVPYFQEQVKTNLNCQNAHQLNTQIKTTYQRMLELREEETSNLEDQLKQEDDPRKMIDLVVDKQ
ncbi:MAG: hypothetical protein AAF806_13700 [Bacteroidota bacterium]